MPRYIVKDGHKKYNGKLYAPGDAIECEAEVALQLRLEPAREDVEGKKTEKKEKK